MTKLLLILASLVCLAPALHAQMPGSELQRDCAIGEKDGHYYESGKCGSFITGTEAGYGLSVYWNKLTPDYCLPDGVTQGQVAKVVVKYMDDHPEKLHLRAEILVINSLIAAFPCTPEPPMPKK